MKLNNSVLITGAGRGLGLALTQAFLEKGWLVHATVRKKKDSQALAALGENCHPIITDVKADEAQTEITKALQGATGLDVLINNAGLGGSGTSLATTDIQEVSALLEVHCLGALRISQAAAPFIKPGGLILNISSRFGSTSKNGDGEFDEMLISYSYRIAKAAQNMLTLCLSREFKNSGIRACAVHPGKLKTATSSLDADRDPGEAATELLARLAGFENGKYYSLFEGEIEW